MAPPMWLTVSKQLWVIYNPRGVPAQRQLWVSGLRTTLIRRKLHTLKTKENWAVAPEVGLHHFSAEDLGQVTFLFCFSPINC